MKFGAEMTRGKFAFEISRTQRAVQKGTGGAAFVTPIVRPEHANIIRETQGIEAKGRRRLYEASQTNRQTADFGVSIASGNAQVLNSFVAATARARTLERDNPYAWRALQLFQNNVGGSEPFKLEVKLGKKDASGKFVKEKDSNEKIKAWWKKTGRKENFTVRQDITRDECYWQAIASFIRDGGIIWRKFNNFPNNDTHYGIEPITIDRLDHWLNRPAVGSNNEIQFGVERNRWRAPVAYHIMLRDPGDVFAFSYSPKYRERVPANEIIHLQDIITRAGQDKAMPRFCSVITGLHRLDQYDIAEMSAAISAACYAGFLVRKVQQGTEFQGDNQSDQGQKEINVEPNMLYELDSMQDFKQWNPQHPVEAYPAFTNQNIRRCAVGLGLSHFALSENYEGISYASGRMSLLENRREFKKLQQHFKENLVRQDFEARLKYGLLSGELDMPMTRYQEICDATDFIATRWEWVDPLKDGQANILNIEAGLDSRQRVITESERGGDTDMVDSEQAEDIDSADAHDLPYGTPEVPVLPAGSPTDQTSTAQPPKKNGGKQPPRVAKKGLRKSNRQFISELIAAEDDDEKVDAVLLKYAKRNGNGRNGNGSHSQDSTGLLLQAIHSHARFIANDAPHTGEQ